MSSSLSSRLLSIFSEREEGFINSLQSILSSISSDQYIQQMFDNKLSANYIPDRVCELIRLFLQNDQEIFIEKLIKQIKSLEACFGKSRILKLEEIGNKMMEVSMNHAQKEAEYRKIIQLLTNNQREEPEELDNDYSYNESSNGDNFDLKNLKEIISSLSNSNGNLKNTVKSFQSSFQKDFKKMRSQARKFINRINFSSEALSKLKSENSKLTKQVEQLNNRLKEMKDQNKVLSNKENQFQSELEKIKRKYQKQEESLKASQELEEKMKEKYENKIQKIQNEMKNSSEQLNKKLNLLQDKNKQLKQELENSINQNNTNDGNINELQQKVSQLQNSNRLLKLEVDSKQDTIDKYKNGRAKESQEFQKYLAKLTDQNKKNESEILKKDKQIREIQIDNGKLQNELNQAKQKLSDYENEIQQKHIELKSYLADKEKQSENANEMKNSFSEIIQNKDQELAKRQEKIENHKRERQQLLSQNSDLQKSLSQIQEKLRRKETEIEQKQNAINSLQIENEKLSSRHLKLKSGVSQIQEQVGLKDNEIQLLQNKIQSLRERNSELENSLHNVDQNSIQNQTQLDSKQREIGDLKGQFQKLQSTINRLQEQIKKKDDELFEKQQTIDSFETENNEQTDMNTQLQNTLLQTKDKLRQKEKEIMNLKRTIDEYQRENLKEKVEQIPIIEKEKEEAVKRGENLQKQNQEMKGKISELQLAVHEARQQLNHIKAISQTGPNKEDLTRQLQEYMKENSDLKIQNAHLQNQIQTYKDEAQSLKNNFESTTSQFKEKERTIRQMKEKYNDSQTKMNETQMKFDQMTEKCSEYESSLKMLAKKYQQKEKQISLHKKDKNDIRRKLQSAEEENQKLNISLSNVNDQLHNLKSEIQKKNEKINKLKDSSENQVTIQRELSNTQRSLNEKTSLLNDSENRNSSLMREIEEKEAKICQLSDSILDKDKELKTIQQSEMSAKRQNETLTALTHEQQRKLEEAHKEALALHEQLIKVQNEALTQSESIKAISIDQYREAEGRKQIQQLINQDREKYRNRISKLQEENTSLSVAKVDLQHKFDQLSFENKTLSQLLEAKENELSFEKERGAQDMERATEVTNRIIEENKQLKQQLSDKNSYDKELLNNIRDYYNSIQNLDDIPELVQQMVQTNEEMKLICDKLKISDHSEIHSEISKLIKANDELSNRDERIYALFPDNNRNELPDIIGNMKREFSELQSLKSKLQQLTSSSNIQKSVQSSISSLKVFQKRELELTKVVPDYSFDRLPSDVAQLIHSNQDNSKIIEQICAILSASMPNNLPDLVSGINRKLDNYQNAENQIKQIVLIKSLHDIIPHLQKFVKQNEQLSMEHKKISSLVGSNFEGDDLPSKVSAIINENNANRAILKSLIDCFPDSLNINKAKLINSLGKNQPKMSRKSHSNFFNANDSDSDSESVNNNENELVAIVSHIAHENEDLKKQQKTLVETHLNPAMKKNKELMKERSQIASNLNCNESDNLPQKISDIVKENEAISNKLRKVGSILPHSMKGDDLADQIENALNILNDLQKERSKVKEIMSKDDDFNDNQKSDDVISNLHNLLERKSEYSNQLDEINSIVSTPNDSRKAKTTRKDRGDVSGKVKELARNKEQLQQSLNDIMSTLPDSKSDIQRTLQNMIQRNAEHENVLDKLNDMLPKGDGDIIMKLAQTLKDKQNSEDTLNEIDSLLQSNSIQDTKSKPKSKFQQDNVIDKIKNELIREEQMNEILKHLVGIIPRCSSNEDIVPRVEAILDAQATINSLLESTGNKKSKFNQEIKEEETIEKLKELLEQKANQDQLFEVINSILEPSGNKKTKFNSASKGNQETNVEEMIEKLKDILEQKSNQEKLIEAIESLLPSSSNNNNRKTNDQNDLYQRVQQELEQKKELEEQLSSLQNNLAKISGDNCQTFDDVLNSISELQNRNAEMKDAINSIDDILSNQKSANNVISDRGTSSKKKTPNSKKQKTKRNQNESASNDDFSPLISQIKDNSNALDQIDELFDQSNGLSLVDRIKKDLEKSNEDLQTLASIQSMIPDSSSPADLQEKLRDILNEKESHKDIIQQASSILPQVDSKNNKTKTKTKNNRNNNKNDNFNDDSTANLINQAENAVEEIESMKSLINEIESTLPPSQTKNDILSRLKDELDDKENVQKQLEILHSLIPSSDGLSDLPQHLQKTIKENEDLKACIQQAHQMLSSDENEIEQRKSSQKKKKFNNDDDEIEPDQLLLELSQFKKESEELKNQISELDSLLLQYEEEQQQNGNSKSKSKQFSKPSSKQDETLFDRFKRQLDNSQESTENLDKITKQLFGQTAAYQNETKPGKKSNDDENSRSIEDIQSYIDALQNERETLQQLFTQELEKGGDEDEFPNRYKSGQQNRKQKQTKPKNQKVKNDNEDDKNVLDMANKIISAKNISDDTLAEIGSLLPEKMNANETLVMRLKRELGAKDTLKKQLSQIQSMFPDSNSPEELQSSISSLQEAHNLSKDEQAELSSILEEEGEEGSIDTVQKILKEKKQLETKLKQIDSLLPPNSTNKLKSHSKAPKNEDDNDIVERLKNVLNNENEMKMIIEQLCHILPRCSSKDDVVPQTEKLMKLLATVTSLLEQNRPKSGILSGIEDEIEEEEEIDDESDIDDAKMINNVKKVLNMNKQQNTLLNDIDSLLPQSSKKDKSKPKKEMSLLEKIQNELDKKKDLEEKQQKLQEQLEKISGNECQSFEDVINSISQLQDRNLGMKNTIDSIGTIFSTKATENEPIKKPKKKSSSKVSFKKDDDDNDDKDEDLNQEQLVKKVDEYVDASENTKKLMSEIESLLPPSSGKDDLSTRIKNELNKKNEVQQLTGTLQSMIPGVKTPDELSSKIKELIQENESLKKHLDLLNQILHKYKKDDDEDEIDAKSSLVDHLIPQQQIEQIKKKEKQIADNDDDDDESNNENENYKKNIASRARLVVSQNAIYQIFADGVVSLLPNSEQETTKKTKKSKKAQSSSKDVDNDEDVLTRLKNELKIKEKVTKQLDKLCSLLSISSNDSLSTLFADSLSSKLEEMLSENEALKQKVNTIDSIIPKAQEIDQNHHHEEDDDDEGNDDLIPRCQFLVQSKEKQDSILNKINSLLQKSSAAAALSKNKPKGKSKNKNAKNQENKNDDDIIQKLKNELNDKDQLIQLLDSLKSLTNDSGDETQLINHFKELLGTNNDMNQLFNEICSLLNIGDSNDKESDDENENEIDIDRRSLIIPKIRDLVNQKEELQKSIDEIQSLLPKSKTNESLISRIQKELKKKDNSIKQLETMQSLLPSIKSPDDIFGQMQTVLKENSELKGIILEMIKLLPSSENQGNEEDENDDDNDEENDELLLNENKENVVPKMKDIIKERNNLKQQMDQIITLLNPQPSSKSSSASPVELLKTELKNGRNAQKKISGLLSLIPEGNDPENLTNSVQKTIQDNENMKKILDSLQTIIPSLEEIRNESVKLKDIVVISNNEEEAKPDEDQQIEEEEEENENADLAQRAQMIVSLNEAMKKSIEEFDKLLPNIQNKEKSAVQSPSSQKVKKSMNQQKKKKNDLIIDRLKNELDEKMKLADQMEQINNLVTTSGSGNLTDSLQNILQSNNKFKSLFKDSFDIIKTNKDEENQNESGIDNEEEEEEMIDSEKYLDELKQLTNKHDEMKKEIQSIDELVSQQEQPKQKSKSSPKSKASQKAPLKPEKKQEDLKTRIGLQFDKKKQHGENLDKVVKQLFGESFNYDDDNNNKDDDNSRNIENILSNVKALQDERKSVIELFKQEIASGKDTDKDEIEEEEEENENNIDNKLADLANKIISIKKQNEQVLSQINSIVPTQFSTQENQPKSKAKNKQQQTKKDNENQQSLTSRVEQLVSEYKQVKSEMTKINSLFPKSENEEGKDIITQIEELLHSNQDLTAQMDDLQSLFPLTKSQEELKLSVTGMMKEKETLTQLKTEIDNLLSEQFPDNQDSDEEEQIPSKLRRLLKEKEELSVLLGVKEDLKSALEILIDQKTNLKKDYDIMYDILSQLRSVLNCTSNEELLQMVTDQKAALVSSSETFTKMLETLTGTLNPIQIPLSSQVKDRIFTILAKMKKQMDDTDEKIVQIFNKAKRAGYTGNDLNEAVKFIEETATIYEQQRISEEYHGQVSNIREIMSEQGKKYDDEKEQLRSANKKQQTKLNELKEQFSLREQEIIAENEENKKKIVSLQYDLERANKAKNELLLLACGQPSDIEFLRNNLSRNENILLQNAEKNRKIALQTEEKAKFGKK